MTIDEFKSKIEALPSVSRYNYPVTIEGDEVCVHTMNVRRAGQDIREAGFISVDRGGHRIYARQHGEAS